MKVRILVWITLLLSSLCFSAEPDAEHNTADWMVWALTTAAPYPLGDHASVVAPDGSVLREGSNGWTCLSASPFPMPETGYETVQHAVPACMDMEAMKWMQAYKNGVAPQLDRDGYMWMLHGDMGADNTSPYVTLESEASDPEEWIVSGPHLMILPANPDAYQGLSANFNTGAPYVMWPESPLAHLMIPVQDYYQYQAPR